MQDLSTNFKVATKAIVARSAAASTTSATTAAVATPAADDQDDCIVTWGKCLTYKLKRLDFADAHKFMVECDIKFLEFCGNRSEGN